jgi:hypothetical protein
MSSINLNDVFEEDETSKPIKMFRIIKDKTSSCIKEASHCRHALTAVAAIDSEITALLDQITSDPAMTPNRANQIIKDAEILHGHASKVVAQAIYLDSDDRNSWQTISQIFIKKPGEQEMLGGLCQALKDFQKKIEIPKSVKPRMSVEGIEP